MLALEPGAGRGFGRLLANWLFPLYVLMITGGYFALRGEGSMAKGNELNVDRALFASINAATMTGFQQTIGMDQYLEPARYTILGLMIGGTILSMLIGSLAVVRILRMRYSDLAVVRWTIGIWAGCVFVGTGFLTPGRSVFEAFFLAVSGFGNCGLTSAGLPEAMGWQTHLVLMPLAIFGGIGVPAVMEVWGFLRGKVGESRRHEDTKVRQDRAVGLSVYTRTVIGMTAGIYLVFLVLFLVLQWEALWSSQWRTILVRSSLQAVNSRTAGFGFSYAYAFPRAMQWAMMVAMVIGASPAGSAGGIKTTAVVELFRGTRRILRGELPGRSFAIGLMWIGMYGLVILIGLLALLFTDPQRQGDQLLLEVISAMGNVGLSYDPISIVGPGLFTLAGVMFLGRMLPLLVLWWQADTVGDGELPVA